MFKPSPLAEQLLRTRYYLKDHSGDPIEDWGSLCSRVASEAADQEHTPAAQAEWFDRFFHVISNAMFLPNSPTLMGAKLHGFTKSGCFIISVEDSLDSIMNSAYEAAKITQCGGGFGLNFSKIRPSQSLVGPVARGGQASGPVSFFHIFNSIIHSLKQGNTRKGAMMANLHVGHPDIMKFIRCKEDINELQNMNISVLLTDDFMKAVDDDAEWTLTFDTYEAKMPAKEIWDAIVEQSWMTGDPGVMFIDTINRYNTVPRVGKIKGSNPCSEVLLPPYSSCNLGSIDISKFVAADGVIKWSELTEAIYTAVRFLDNIIDSNYYPLQRIGEMTKKIRPIGLGIMGLADVFIMKAIPYDSEEAVNLTSTITEFVNKVAMEASVRIGEEKGSFPAFRKSIFPDLGYTTMRNCQLTSIAPTGSISMLAGCSSGLEPYFSYLPVKRDTCEGRKIEIRNKWDHLIEYTTEIDQETGNEVTTAILKPYMATAYDIHWKYHIAHQAAAQKYIQSGVSKTVNLPATATRRDVDAIYQAAYNTGCKGVTVFRNGSAKDSLIKTTNMRSKRQLAEDTCPNCGALMSRKEGCKSCDVCGTSACSIS